MIKKFRVKLEDAGKRADVFVAEQFPEFARSSMRGFFEKGLALVNGLPEEPGDKLKLNDLVSVDTTPLVAKPEDIELPVIYEDDDVIVINKPAGILTHSKGVLNLEPSVASFLASKIKDSNLTGNRAGVVHRLDRATSGVIIGAKNQAAQTYLQKQFSLRMTKKTYAAVVEGIPDEQEAIIDVPIMRNPKRPQTFKVGKEGKAAQTYYKLKKSLNCGDREYSILILKPVTGRTHQIRVHLAYINHPVVGDRVYGREGPHLMLHAEALEVILPSGERKTFVAPLPEYFKTYKWQIQRNYSSTQILK